MKITMRYDFLIETYETERIKVISAWSMFTDKDLSGTASRHRYARPQYP